MLDTLLITAVASEASRRGPQGVLGELKTRVGVMAQKETGTFARMKWIQKERGNEVVGTLHLMLGEHGYDSTSTRHQAVDRLLPWLAEWLTILLHEECAMSLENRFVLEDWVARNDGNLGQVIDWAAATRPVLTMELGPGRALYLATRWHRQLAEKAGTRPDIQIPVVHRWDDGWYVVRLESWEQFQQETKALGHCIGMHANYYDAYKQGERFFHSLRDPDGMPVATSEEKAKTGELMQFKGKRDMLLSAPHWAHEQGLRFTRRHFVPGRVGQRRAILEAGEDGMALFPLEELLEERERAHRDGDERWIGKLDRAILGSIKSVNWKGRSWWFPELLGNDNFVRPDAIAARVFDRKSFDSFPFSDQVTQGLLESVDEYVRETERRLNVEGLIGYLEARLDVPRGSGRVKVRVTTGRPTVRELADARRPGPNYSGHEINLEVTRIAELDGKEVGRSVWIKEVVFSDSWLIMMNTELPNEAVPDRIDVELVMGPSFFDTGHGYVDRSSILDPSSWLDGHRGENRVRYSPIYQQRLELVKAANRALSSAHVRFPMGIRDAFPIMSFRCSIPMDQGALAQIMERSGEAMSRCFDMDEYKYEPDPDEDAFPERYTYWTPSDRCSGGTVNMVVGVFEEMKKALEESAT
jgi:hypothetical protein